MRFASVLPFLFSLAMGMAIQSDNQQCKSMGSACTTALACCPGLECFLPPKSGYEPEGLPAAGQGICIHVSVVSILLGILEGADRIFGSSRRPRR